MRWTGNLREKFKYHMYDKGLISKTYKKLMHLNNKWKQSQPDKQTKKKDHHLKRWPVYLTCHSNGQRCVNVYLALPIIRDRSIQVWSSGIVAVVERT